VLATDYRPRTFGDVAGQGAAAAVLYRIIGRGKTPSAMLFHGPHGCGKTSMARICGAALNCAGPVTSGNTWPCGSCPSCKAVWESSSLDVMEVDAASNGTVDHIRRIRDLAQYSTAGEWRVIVLDEAHGMSAAGFDALLKILEERVTRTTFILVTTERRKIPRTVASRCLEFPFDAISPAVIRDRLEQVCAAEQLILEPPLLSAISERAGGAMRDALMMVEQATDVGITTLELWRELLGETDFAPGLLSAAASGDYPALFAALDEVICGSGDYGYITARIIALLRDLLVLTAGAPIMASGQALEARQQLAGRLGAPAVVEAMRVMWDLQVKVRSDDRRSSLELAAVMLAEKLCPVATLATPSNGHRKATTGELSAILG
jgi:DNA polymerase-3 subunit gamma/tau